MSGSGKESFTNVREWSGDCPGCLRVVRVPPGCLEVVGRPYRMSGSGKRPSWMSGSGLVALQMVWE